MGFLKKLFGGAHLDGDALARSPHKSDYAQIELLAQFQTVRPVHDAATQSRWSRVLPRSYDETLALFQKQDWLKATTDGYRITAVAQPFVDQYAARLEHEKNEVMPQVRAALAERDTGAALEIRRQYEARQPLGTAAWTGPEPQLSHSALTRRILYLDHWLLDGYSAETIEWLKRYAAEQHLWGVYWRLPDAEFPAAVRAELDAPELGVAEAAYWKAYQLALRVDNQETWQRCKGGDHVRRIAIAGPDDVDTCDHCREFLGQQFLVARVPDLPHRSCTSPRGCRCRYEPVLESYEDL